MRLSSIGTWHIVSLTEDQPRSLSIINNCYTHLQLIRRWKNHGELFCLYIKILHVTIITILYRWFSMMSFFFLFKFQFILLTLFFFLFIFYLFFIIIIFDTTRFFFFFFYFFYYYRRPYVHGSSCVDFVPPQNSRHRDADLALHSRASCITLHRGYQFST